MTKIDRESVEQAWEAIHDAALMRHKDGGAELARLVINADDAFEALAAERDALKAERDKAVAMKDALVGDKIMLRSELAAVEAERNRLAGLLEEALEQCADALNMVVWGGEFTCFVDAQWSTVNNALEKARATLAKLEKERRDETSS